jgi:hypothetical protein
MFAGKLGAIFGHALETTSCTYIKGDLFYCHSYGTNNNWYGFQARGHIGARTHAAPPYTYLQQRQTHA